MRGLLKTEQAFFRKLICLFYLALILITSLQFWVEQIISSDSLLLTILILPLQSYMTEMYDDIL